MRHFFPSRFAVAFIRRCLFGTIVSLALVLVASRLPAQSFYDAGDPTAQEQQVLCLLNRARVNPAEEGRRVAAFMRAGGIAADGVGRSPDQVAFDFASYPPRPPLAMNAALLAAARAHAAELAARRVLSHRGADGSTAQARDERAGYTGLAGWECAASWITVEALHYEYEVDHRNLDHATHPLGHRLMRLDLHTGVLAEVGVGLVAGVPIGYEVENYGLQLQDGPAFLVGTVYGDANTNGAYDPGEGVAGVAVRVEGGARYTLTGAAGGYAMPLVRATDHKPFDGAVVVRVSGLPDGERRVTVQVGRLIPVAGNNFEYYGPFRTNVALDVRVGDGTGPPAAPPAVVGVVAATSTASPVTKGKFIFTRTGGEIGSDLTVRYGVAGTAVGGVHYKTLPGVVTILAGQTSATVKVKMLPGAAAGTSVKVKVLGAPGYGKDRASAEATISLQSP